MRIRKRSACISAGFGASHGAAVPKVQTLNISGGHSSLSSENASKLDTQESQKQIVQNHDLSPVCDRKLERTAAIAEQVAPFDRFDTTGSSPGGNHHHAAKDVFEDSSPWMPSHTYRLLKLHGYSASLNLHHVSANMQAEKATLPQTDSLPAESCVTRDQLENGSFNGNTPVCSVESTVATSNKQRRIRGEECVSSKKKDQAMITARQPKCDDNGKIGVLTTPRSTPQLLNNQVSISTLAKGAYMDNSSLMFIDKKLGITGELQKMAINDHAAKLRISGKGKGDLKQINVDRASVTHDENEVKQDQREIEAKQDHGEIEVKQDQKACKEKRCSRKGGGGWQCKNMRPGDGSSVYCDYHQVLTSAQHRATLNARSKISKENNRKRVCIMAGKSDQPLQNMVDVKLLQLPFLPSKEHTYEDVKAYDIVSSMGDKRTFQEAGCAEKQQPFNGWILKDDVEPEADSVALPWLVEADTPKTQHTHQEADSKFEGCSLNFRKRRAGNATVVLEAAGCSILNITMNAEECATDEILGATDATVGKIHKSDDGIENSNEVEEVMRCKQIDGRGVQCTKRSSMFCEHHSNERLCQKILKEPTLNDSKHTLSLTNINLSSTGKYSDALTVIGPRSNVQDKNSSDANKHSPVGMANATNVVVGGSHVKSSLREKKSVHVQQTLDRDQVQNDSIHKKHDKSVNGLHQQLQEQQLLWWQCKQHDKDGVVNTERNTGEQPQLDTLPRRSERKLIIDICKATAAEKPTKNLNVEVTQSKLLQNLSKLSNIVSAVEHSTSIEPMDKIDAVPPVLHTSKSSRLDLTQEQQCKRHDGRGWQCKIMCARGKLYCEHHLKLRRSYIELAGVDTNNRLQTQPCKERSNVIKTSKYPAKMANGHGNKKPMQHVIMQAGHAPQKEHDEQVQQCGRHDGRGWQCKSKCRQGSIYCEYHQEKLRLNHATWNAKVKLLQQRKKEEAYMHKRLEKQEQSRKRSMVETAKEGTKTPVTGSLYLTKKKMRSLKEIEACAIT